MGHGPEAIQEGPQSLKDRYDDADRAARYRERSSARDEAELRLLDRAFARLSNIETVLDVPAGTGRTTRHLESLGHRVVAADASRPMLTAVETPERALVADALNLPFADDAVDACLCFRFVYHLDGAAARRRLLGELARVARRNVLISIRHPVSFHAATRRLKAALGGTWRDRHATTVGRLAREARPFGLRVVAADAQSAFRKEFWLVTLAAEG